MKTKNTALIPLLVLGATVAWSASFSLSAWANPIPAHTAAGPQSQKPPTVYYRLLSETYTKSLPNNATETLMAFRRAWSKGAGSATTYGGRPVTEVAQLGKNYVTVTRDLNASGDVMREWGYKVGGQRVHSVLVSDRGWARKVLTNDNGKFELLTSQKDRPELQPERRPVSEATAKKILAQLNARRGAPPREAQLFFGK